jgi:anthranilate phosphoribosyltransferase
VTPEDLGMHRADLTAIAGGSPEDNAAVLRSVLAGEEGAARDVIALNAAAAILVAGGAHDLGSALDKARVTIDSGAALGVLEALVRFTTELAA